MSAATAASSATTTATTTATTDSTTTTADSSSYHTYASEDEFVSILTTSQVNEKLEKHLGIYKSMLTKLKWNHYIIAGGFIHDLFSSQKRTPNDIDIFIKHEDGFKEILDYFHRNQSLGSIKINIFPSMIEIEPENFSYRFQLINVLGLSNLDIINRFDMDFVKCYFDGTNIRVSPCCLTAWATTFISNTHPIQKLKVNRIEKALNKGYSFSTEFQENWLKLEFMLNKANSLISGFRSTIHKISTDQKAKGKPKYAYSFYDNCPLAKEIYMKCIRQNNMCDGIINYNKKSFINMQELTKIIFEHYNGGNPKETELKQVKSELATLLAKCQKIMQ
jgi:hypothetical protein